MAPKEQPSKKAKREKAAKAIEDATFGLKNKGKSAKVKQFVSRVEQSVKNNNGTTAALRAKDAKKDAAKAKQLQEEEMRLLFNEGISNQFGKKKSAGKDAAEKLGIADTSEDTKKLLDEFSSDESSDDDDEDRTLYLDDGPAGAVEVFREKTIEDIIEEQRMKLQKEGKVGTPVTAETFAAWRQMKLARKQALAEARMKEEALKKKGGKGLSVLSGKELFKYDASLFVDDDAALNESEETEFNAQLKLEEEQSLAQERMEAAKAQAEQERLMEAQRLEDEANAAADEERRERARRPDRVTFLLGNIVINQIVFDVEEKEDLGLFKEDLPKVEDVEGDAGVDETAEKVGDMSLQATAEASS
jgi:hypothetical protein